MSGREGVSKAVCDKEVSRGAAGGEQQGVEE